MLLRLVATLLATFTSLLAVAAQPEAQRWKGVIELPGMKLEFTVRLTHAGEAGQAAGTMDIPMQGLSGAELSDVEVTPEAVTFTLALPSMPANAHAHFFAKLEDDGTTARGELRQAGGVFPLVLERIAADAEVGPSRPQHPTPPYPYTQREVAYTNAQDGTRLAGTLTLPPGAGPHPVVVLITGSGPQDRDETVFAHKPFLVIADHLTRRGVAVLRADDRGVGGSTGSVSESTSHDFSQDVLAAIAMLKTIPEIDPARIGLVGHSEGGIIAPMVAADSRDVAFIVMLAGTGLRGRDILTLQTGALFRAAGVQGEPLENVLKHHRRLMDLIEGQAERDELSAAARDLIRSQQAVQGGAADESLIESTAEQALRSLDTPWLRHFLLLDPREALRRVKVPVLALFGELDLQVPPRENMPEIEKALMEAGNRDVTIRELPRLNHLFQTATTGLVAEYALIEETFAPAALDAMTEWILARAGLAK